jgi:DcaP outer membrane protein
MKAQMESVQAQINAMSLSSAAAGVNSKAATATASGTTTTVTATATSAPGAGSLNAQQDAGAQAVEARLTPARQVNPATASYQTTSQDQIAAPRIDNAPLDPRYPDYFRLPGTQTLMRIGGYFKTDFIYDTKPAGNADSFIPSTFPIPQLSGINTTTVSIRPTRFNFDFLIPASTTSVRTFIEFDMFGTNATTPRLRHAYAQVLNVLLGQSFSNFMDPDSGPDTLDFQGPNAQVSIRNPQLRYSLPLGDKRSLSFSVEKASSDVSFTTTTFNSLPASPAPDGAIKFRQDFTGGHFQISALFRDPSAYLPDGRSASVFGWGIDATGSNKVFRRDVFVYQGAYGAGMERYVNDTSGLGIDAAPTDAADPHLEAVPIVATYGGYQHYWNKSLRSSAVYGFVQVENTDLEPGSAYHKSDYSAVNLIWTPFAFGSLNLGTEFLYGELIDKNNARATASRFMFSAKYNFIRTGTAKSK